MNKVFKVIWSKTKGCYVVTSELAKRRTKAPKSNIVSKTVVAGVLACVLSYGIANPVFASYTAGGGVDETEHDSSIVIGKNAVATQNTDEEIINLSPIYNAEASYGVVIGDTASVTASNGIAIGTKAKTYCVDSVGIGLKATTKGIDTTVLGTYSSALSNFSTAIGSQATANSAYSVAVGVHSVTSDNYTVSFGHKIGDIKPVINNGDEFLEYTTFENNLYRRLVNVANGIDDHDVTTVSQLNEKTKFIGINSSGSTDANYLGGGATGNDAIAIGKSASAAGAASSVAIGRQTVADTDASIAIGTNASVLTDNISSEDAKFAIAIGTSAKASGRENIAIGPSAIVNGTINSIGIGDDVRVSGTSSTIVGSSSETTGRYTTASGNYDTGIGADLFITGEMSSALGVRTTIRGNNSVALGANSVTDDDKVVSFGHTATDTDQLGNAYGSALTRRLTNVSNGTSATDAATVGQIQTVTAGTNVTINTTTNTNGSTNKEIIVNGAGTVTKNNTGLINGNTLYTEVRPADNGNYVIQLEL